MSSEVLILGNGKSRSEIISRINSWKGEIWVCNWAFFESPILPRIDRVYTVHKEVALSAYNYRMENQLDYLIIGREGKIDQLFIQDKGWSSGNQALSDALLLGYDILVGGFDFGGEDMYQPKPVEGFNFRKQFEELRTMVPNFDERVTMIYPEGRKDDISYYHDGQWIHNRVQGNYVVPPEV
jgi:hypothetical protein